MRRKDREKDSDFAFEVLQNCEYATLATVNTDHTPYCIPISIVLLDRTIYFHSANEGLKLTNIAHNTHVCVSCVRRTRLIPEKFTTEFESAVARGTCALVTEEPEKILALRLLCEKYASSNMVGFDNAIAQSLAKTAIGKINITQITGKAYICNK